MPDYKEMFAELVDNFEAQVRHETISDFLVHVEAVELDNQINFLAGLCKNFNWSDDGRANLVVALDNLRYLKRELEKL